MRHREALPLTGERTTPGLPAENYWFRRHVAGYRIAARTVRGRIVDAGAGEGYGTLLLGRRGTAFGLELDEAAVSHAAGRYGRASFARADLCRLPLGAASVDAIVALQVLEHLWCPDEFLAACRRSLLPGGVLVASTPNRSTFPVAINPSHVHEYDAGELRGLLSRHVDELRVVGLGHRLPLRLVERALRVDLQRRLIRDPYRALPWWLRMVVRAITSRNFGTTAPQGSLDLIAIGRVR